MLPSILMRSSFAMARSKMASRFKTRPATSHSSQSIHFINSRVLTERHAPAMTPLKGRKIRPIASFFPPMKTDDGSLICVILNSAKTEQTFTLLFCIILLEDKSCNSALQPWQFYGIIVYTCTKIYRVLYIFWKIQ